MRGRLVVQKTCSLLLRLDQRLPHGKAIALRRVVGRAIRERGDAAQFSAAQTGEGRNVGGYAYEDKIREQGVCSTRRPIKS